ncbi:hypothetical protein [Paenibacillus planticolens]|uniref:Uncharacterized protein n=1 Tax=Paenibacillus planticolens TaxID=2654976 RepID=A0ABX1ZRI2_9BACL|nr:hypothetical protein [Paenibacillus planticolens]NOV02333.1 hypothetical protein [Paenibacillus planticolens]
MKQSKWFKWQVGLIASATAAFLFHEVKASPSFDQATRAANSTTDKKISTVDTTQDYMDGWASQTMSGTGDPLGTSDSTSQSSRNHQSESLSKKGNSSETFSHSRTGRS